jgi:lysozyme
LSWPIRRRKTDRAGDVRITTAHHAVVDLSQSDSEPDFAVLRAGGIIGVVHKATEGTRFVDSAFARREAPARRAGLR